MKETIRTILKERGGFVSGQELSDLLGVSRTAVWKAIRQLEEAGYEIEAVRNKGYRLVAEPDLLTKGVIAERLSAEWAGHEILSFDEARRKKAKVGRNDPCPCGSGKKYKNCCMRKDMGEE